MAISKTLSLPRPLNLPKPAPTAQTSTQKPAAGVAGHASTPQGGIKPNAKPQGEFNGPPRGGFNPNAKPSDTYFEPGGWANHQPGTKPSKSPSSDVFFEKGGWANRQPATGAVNGPAHAAQNLSTGSSPLGTVGPKPPSPQPWTTYGEAIELNGGKYKSSFGDKGAYDIGAAIDKAFGQGVGPDAGFSGGAETKPGGGWGDLLEANGAVPPGYFEPNRANGSTDIGFSGGAETKPGGGWGDLLEANGAVPPGYFDPK